MDRKCPVCGAKTPIIHFRKGVIASVSMQHGRECSWARTDIDPAEFRKARASLPHYDANDKPKRKKANRRD